MAALVAARSLRPDVVVMGRPRARRRRRRGDGRIAADPSLAAVRVLVLTTFDVDDHVFAALRAGASGSLLKDAEPADLVRAVRTVADGNALRAPSATRAVVAAFAGRPGPSPSAPATWRVDDLTDREREIVALVGTGRSNGEIAADLVISPATARTHVSRAMTKLGARDRAQLVVFAYESGLVRPSSR